VSARPTPWLTAVAAAHRRTLEVVATLTDGDVGAPSRLPDWTVGHVLTHLARNADGNTGMVEAAARGEIGDLYPGGRQQRADDIEAGAHRPVAEMAADLTRAVASLEAAWSALPDDAWDRPGRATAGHELTMGEWVFRRWREVEMHLVDLGTDRYRPSDWPAAYVDEELRRAVTDFGDQRGLLAWLTGRAGAPEPPAWP
jgi:maleylpyruvate isomerase